MSIHSDRGYESPDEYATRNMTQAERAAYYIEIEGRAPDHSLDLAPPAILSISDDHKTITVCAWCEGKEAADDWCRDRGYEITHGICPVCLAAFKDRPNVKGLGIYLHAICKP